MGNGAILSLYPYPFHSRPRFAGAQRHGNFTTRRTHQSTAWENAAIMSSLVSFGGEELTPSWQRMRERELPLVQK